MSREVREPTRTCIARTPSLAEMEEVQRFADGNPAEPAGALVRGDPPFVAEIGRVDDER